MKLLPLMGTVFILTIAFCLVYEGIVTKDLQLFILSAALVLICEATYLGIMVKAIYDKLEKMEKNK